MTLHVFTEQNREDRRLKRSAVVHGVYVKRQFGRLVREFARKNVFNEVGNG